MAKTMCPLCGEKTHVNTGNPAAYEQRYPEILIVGYACKLCEDCTPELVVGDRVCIRDKGRSPGHLERIATSGGGFKLYYVQRDDGGAMTYPRIKLAKLPA